MRRGSKPEFVFNGEQLIGATLSADYCAEHEWGIKRLREMFEMNEKARGLDKGIIKNTKNLFQKEYTFSVYSKESPRRSKKVMYAGFLVDSYPQHYEGEKPPYDLIAYSEEEELCAAWSDRDLGVLARKGSEGEKHLQTIYDACKAGDGMICFASQMKNNPFERAGLCIMIRSRIPEEWQKAAIEEEDEKAQLQKAWKDAGGPEVMEQLKKAGKGWFSLGTRITYIQHLGEEGRVLASWLNPLEQRLYESCWATVDDLKDWLEGKGRIIKTGKK